MIQTLDKALLMLQAALCAREILAPDHPSVGASLDGACTLLKQALEQRQELAVAAIGDRLVCDGQPLPSQKQLLEVLFARLRARGTDSLVITRAVSVRDLAALLEHVDLKVRAPAPSSAGLRVGHVRRAAPAGGAAPQDRASEAMAGVYKALQNAGGAGGAGQSLDLESVVNDIASAVDMSKVAMLRLAAVKDMDEYTFIHTVNVSIQAGAFAEAVGLSKPMVADIITGALLHDVGKSVIPLSILNKGGQLTPEERNIIQLHPAEGARLLLNRGGIPDLAVIITYEHHMHLDGTGYPSPHRGGKPHLASQLVQLADVFDALRTHRPYRKALPTPEVLEIMSKGVGSKYDRELFDVFVSRIALRAPETALDASLRAA